MELELAAGARSLPWPIPVLWVAPNVRFADAVEAVRSGAGALVSSPIDSRVPGPALSRIVRAHREATRNLALERVLEGCEIDWE